MSKVSFSILHISDVHFGVPDPENEQPRITNALIDAVSKYHGKIDYCFFTGDLSFSAQTEQFNDAEKWLEKIYKAIGNPKAKMFICPGNHDSDRRRSDSLILRSSAISLDKFLAFKKRKWGGSQHLTEFERWHKSFKIKHNWIASDWSKNVNLIKDDHIGLNINFILSNSAILSCDNSDKSNLCIDYPELNSSLLECNASSELIIYAMHHPLGDNWFTEWNEKEVRTLLSQKVGCHISLTGHLHNPKAEGFSNLYGQSLVELSSGAAYAGSSWPQAFSIWNIEPDNNKISPSTYRYHNKPGQWIVDNALSNEILVILPSGKDKYPKKDSLYETKSSKTFHEIKRTQKVNFFPLKLNQIDVIDLSVDNSIFIDDDSDTGNFHKQFEIAIWLPKAQIIDCISGPHYVSAVAFCFPSIDIIANDLCQNISENDINNLSINSFKKIPEETKEKIIKALFGYVDKGFIVTVSLPQLIFDSTGKNTKSKNTMYGLINTLLNTTLKANVQAEFQSINIHINNHACLNNGIRKRISSITKKILPSSTKVTNNIFPQTDVSTILERTMGLVSWFVTQSDNNGVDYWLKKVQNNHD